MSSARRIALPFAIIFSLLLVGCGGGDSDPAADDVSAGGGAASAKCENLSWNVASAEPLDAISVNGVPDDMTELYAVVKDGATDAESITFVERQQDGSVSVLAPLNPSGSPDGGDVEIIITSGDTQCPAETISLKPLPPAAADVTQTFADKLSTYQGLVYADLGVTADEIRNLTIGSFSADLIPLYLAQGAIDALNDYLADGSTQLSAEQLDLINRLLDKGDVNSDMQSLIDNHVPFSASSGLLAGKPSLPTSTGAALRTAQQSNGSCDSLPANTLGAIEISSAEALSEYMSAQQDADIAINGKYTQQITQTTGYMATAVGIVSAPVGIVAGLGLYAHSMVNGYRANLYPSKFVSLDFQLTENGQLPEDYMDSRGPGVLPRWENADAKVVNNGWNLSKPAFDTLLQAAGVLGAGSAAISEAITGKAASTAVGIADAIGSTGFSEIGSYLDSKGLSSDCLQIPSKTWGPIDVTDEPWVEPVYHGFSVEELGHQTFKPVGLGSTTLELKVISSKFGNKTFSQEKDINILSKAVVLTASAYRADPDDSVSFTATIANSRFPEVAPTWSFTGGTEQSRSSSNGQHTLNLQMPSDEASFPVKVTAESQTMVLPEGGNPRKGEVEVKSTKIELAPQQVCLKVGETRDFSALLSGGGDATLNWSVSGGSLSTSATSAAPHTVTYSATTEGDFTIKAALSTDAKIFDEATVNVGACVDMYVWGAAVASIDAPNDECAEPALDNTAFEEKLVLDEPPIPPARPANTWQGRVETLTASLGQTYTGSLSEGGGQCKVYNASASTDADITYGSDKSGQATLDQTVSYEYNCEEDAEGDTGCSFANSAAGGWSVMHYVDIENTVAYRYKANINCSATSSDSGYAQFQHAMKFSVIFSRFLNQQGEAVDANYCSLSNDCSAQEVVLPIAETLNCMEGGSINIDQVINLRGPANAGQKDLVVAGMIMTPDATAIDITDPSKLAEYQKVGPHNASMNFSAKVSFIPAN